eukprot:6818362-Prymnesium_polylepis.1
MPDERPSRSLCDRRGTLHCLFGQVVVVATFVRADAIRCRVPAASADRPHSVQLGAQRAIFGRGACQIRSSSVRSARGEPLRASPCVAGLIRHVPLPNPACGLP